MLEVLQSENDWKHKSILKVVIGINVSEVGIGVCFSCELRVEIFISFLQHQVILIESLNGFNRIILVQFVDVIGDAGVKWGSRDRVDDCGIMGLLLVSLAVSVHQ